MPAPSLHPGRAAALLAPLAAIDAELAAHYPGGVPVQPAHTCYVPADRLRAGEHRRWGEAAQTLLAEHAPDAAALASAVGLELPAGTYEDVVRLLSTTPVHDLRVDLEDGYGRRPDAEEDAAVDAAVEAVAADPPPAYGLRVKALEGELAPRAARTLDRWTTGLAAQGLPPGVVTLPKVQSPTQVAVLAALLDEIEGALGRSGTRVELQIETGPGVLDRSGRVPVPAMVAAGRGRVTGLHFGTYDFTASLGISPRGQSLDAPLADAAKDLLQLAAASTGVAVCDGSSNVLPVGDRSAVLAAWRLHAGLVQRAMVRGLWQGWDMHPGQLVSRWTAVVAHLRRQLPEVHDRLAGRVGNVADEPATVRMLTSFVDRAAALGIV